ncbi:hypothetical protein CCAN11_1940002 [Capnocytophaga canimorsus]|uniref:Uncharacterized protein n=1 Tax=Capnocytophaga canimorsus TaxID=28188 RepID=A0A0B7ICF0_9FLAO|nr:hypothetical protein CCAN11_1940002 [Capnocytophaga canimorsus]
MLFSKKFENHIKAFEIVFSTSISGGFEYHILCVTLPVVLITSSKRKKKWKTTLSMWRLSA